MSKIFSEEIYRPEFNLDGPHLVAASAGTGKTYNIQSIYARLVAEKGFRASEIQVMTFTEAATKELRSRVRRMLSDLSKFYDGATGGFKPDELSRLEKLRACARANIGGGDKVADGKARGRVELALMEFDQAAISTIHGFCNRALRRFAFETGSAFASELADGKDADLSRRARDWWRREHGHLSGTPENLDAQTVVDYVRALSQKADWKLREDAGVDTVASFALAKGAEIVGAYEAERPLREEQTFDDLLRAVRDALRGEHGPALAALLRGEFKAALVDEFQDTDPVQYDIFRRVFLDPAADPRPSLFFVGDPKQAIYSFRGGDIFTYKAAVQTPEMEAGTYCLDRNFRSTPRLVDAVNMLFRDSAEESESRTFGDEAIPYGDDVKASDGIEAFKLPDGSDDPRPFRFKWVGNASDRLAAVVDSVLEVLGELGGQGVTPKDIAILVPSHGDERTLRDLLREKGVPAVLQKAGNVFASETAFEFLQVLAAMALSGGTGQIKSALATSFFDYEAAVLAGDGEGQILADGIALFGELNGIWLARGFNAAFAALSVHPRCDMKRRFAAGRDGERKLADVLQVVDLASAAVMELGPAPATLVSWLSERINLSGEDAEEEDAEAYARQLESENDAVKIMTSHVSKGLEFPVAIVPLSRGNSLKPPYFVHEDGGFFASVKDADKAAADREREAERMRLLYVAFTRASKRTIVISKTPPEIPSLQRLLDNASAHGAEEPDSPIAFETFDPEIAGERPPYERRSAGPVSLEAAPVPPAFPLAPTKGSYTSLSPHRHGGGGNDEDDEHDFDNVKEGGAKLDFPDTHPVFALAGGRKPGICWHAIFEQLPFDASAEEIASVAEATLGMYGLLPDDAEKRRETVEIVADMVAKSLAYPVEAPDGSRFSLREIGWADRFSEWEFNFSSRDSDASTAQLAALIESAWKDDPGKVPFLAAMRAWNRNIPKGFLKGFLDLVFRKDGRFYIVDWKTNTLNRRASGFSREGICAEMASEGYFFQYLLYAVVLHRYLKETMGADYLWERHFGGVRYYFLRGIAAGGEEPVFADRPSAELLDRLGGALGLGGAE